MKTRYRLLLVAAVVGFACLRAPGDEGVQDGDGDKVTPREVLKDILSRREKGIEVGPGGKILGPTKIGSITNYANTSGIPIEQVVKEIEQIVDECLKAPSSNDNARLCSSAVFVLGQLGSASSAPVVRKALDVNHNSVIYAYVELAREDSVEMARAILRDMQRFDSMERFSLYRRLGPYAMPIADSVLKEKRLAIRKFLLEALDKDPDPGCIDILDTVLAKASPAYEKSLQREAILLKRKDGPAGGEAEGKLKQLRAMAKARRTDLSTEAGQKEL